VAVVVAESHTHSVLVVDDDEQNLTALVLYLDAEGFTVHGACGGTDALEQLRAGFLPCGMLIDVVMPVMDGWDLIEQMRQDSALAGISVVIHSGAELDPRRARHLGVSATFVKPTDPKEIVAALAEHCPRRRKGPESPPIPPTSAARGARRNS
jgi:CheY-like chemotaxis protein